MNVLCSLSHSTRGKDGLQQQVECPDTLFKLARQRACANANEIGYTFLVDGEKEEQRLSYGELDLRARAIAARIQSICQPGDQVLLLFGPGLDCIITLFACQYAGVVPVPAYPPDPLRTGRTLPRLRAIVSDCGATLALGTAESLGWLGSLLPSELGLRSTLAIDSWRDWVGLSWKPPETHPDQIALLQYTSGSTAEPRGVLITHRNLWHQFECVRVGDRDDSVGVSWLPLYHDLGLIGGVLTPIYYRRHTVFMSPLAFVQHPLRWLWAIHRYRATTTGSPNFALDLCVSKFSPKDAVGLDLSSLEIILTGAEPVRADSLERFTRTFAPYGLRPDVWRPAYGMAESTLGITGVRLGSELTWHDFSLRALEQNRAELIANLGEPVRRLVGCGVPIPDTEVILVDPVSCTEVPPGQIGEVWVHGPTVGLGYWNRSEETEAIFRARLVGSDRGPFLRTGDLGFFWKGQLYLTGRLKEVMIFWGRNVYPQDIEITTWNSHPLLKENACAAFAVEVEEEEQLVVVQEVTRPRKIEMEAVAETVRQAIHAEHQVPLYALVLIKAGTLPKTSSGKIQRHTTRESFLNNELAVIQEWRFPTARPSAPVERELPSAEAIRSWLVTRIARHRTCPEDQIDVQARLTQYVMDSVSAVAIAMDLQQWLGRTLSPTLLYDSPSILVLAERLANLPPPNSEGLLSSASVDQMSAGEVDQALAQLLGDLPITVLQPGPGMPVSEKEVG
jgi:acyl-CoA synthetase (AMP-forming)/AMP-acid ligase II/acyl carrier protein